MFPMFAVMGCVELRTGERQSSQNFTVTGMWDAAIGGVGEVWRGGCGRIR